MKMLCPLLTISARNPHFLEAVDAYLAILRKSDTPSGIITSIEQLRADAVEFMKHERNEGNPETSS